MPTARSACHGIAPLLLAVSCATPRIAASSSDPRPEPADAPPVREGESDAEASSRPLIVPAHRIPSGDAPAEGTVRLAESVDGRTWIEGTLIDEEGRALPGAAVWVGWGGIRQLEASDAEVGPSVLCAAALTDAHGRFRLEAATPHVEAYSLLARAPGRCELRLLQIEAPEGFTLDLGVRVLRRGTPFELQVVDPNGRPVEGAGLVRAWSEGSQAWWFYPQWLGETDAEGIVRTDRLPGMEDLAKQGGWPHVVLPGQFVDELPIDAWKDEPGAPRRFVLPGRAWFEGRIQGMVPGERYAVSTGGQRASVLPWADRNYPSDHRLRSNFVPLQETDGTFRIATWSEDGNPSGRPRITLHMRGRGNAWFPIAVHEPEGATSGRHDRTLTPVDLEVPQVLRLGLSSSDFPELDITVRVGKDTWDWEYSGRGGEVIVPLRRAPPIGMRFVEFSSRAHERIRYWIPHDMETRILELEDADIRPLRPTVHRYVDATTKEPVAGVRWKVYASVPADDVELPVAGGVTGPDGRAEIPSATLHDHAWYPFGYSERCRYEDGDSGDDSVTVIELDVDELEEVRVVDFEGRPVHGAVVIDGSNHDWSVTDANGAAWIRVDRSDDAALYAMPPGCLVMQDEGHDDSLQSWWVPPGGTPLADDGPTVVPLGRCAPYDLHLSSAGAQPHDVRVKLYRTEETFSPSDGHRPGVVRIEHAPLDEHKLDLLDVSTGVRALVEVPHPGAEGRLDIDLTPATLSGVVARADGGSLAGIEVEVEPLLEEADREGSRFVRPDLARYGVTDPEGRFSVPVQILGVPVRVRLSGRCIDPIELEVRPLSGGEARRIEPRPLEPAGSIRVDAEPSVGRPLRVQVWGLGGDDEGVPISDVKSVEPGRPTFFDGLATGSYRIHVIGTFHVLREYRVDVVSGEITDQLVED